MALVVLPSITLITQLVFQSILKNNQDDRIPWYEKIIFRHYTFDETYVPRIDDLLHNSRGNKIINEHGRLVPDVGTYTFVFNKNKIKLVKEYMKKNNNFVLVYRAKALRAKKLRRFVKYLANQKSPDEIDIISIDTSKDTPSMVKLTKLCKDPKPNQLEAIDLIYNEWINNNHESLKVILSGERGIGKTYVGGLLKKKIEQEYKNVNPYAANSIDVLLFDDFNPSSIGVNVKTMIINKASKYTPIIVVINEIDKTFDSVLTVQQCFDPRLKHTRDIGEFHNMLDAMGSNRYIIALYTTEMENIKNVSQYASFIRKGRVDMIIKMDSEHSTVQN